jgi:hypothetical protein
MRSLNLVLEPICRNLWRQMFFEKECYRHKALNERSEFRALAHPPWADVP